MRRPPEEAVKVCEDITDVRKRAALNAQCFRHVASDKLLEDALVVLLSDPNSPLDLLPARFVSVFCLIRSTLRR